MDVEGNYMEPSTAMEYDPSLKGLVLFGGYFTGGPWTSQTWLFF
jgi:hypothetical protein